MIEAESRDEHSIRHSKQQCGNLAAQFAGVRRRGEHKLLGRLMHPLDSPIWTALTTHQSSHALVEGMARRFPPEVAAHGALALPIPQAWDAMARLAARSPVALFTQEPLQTPPGWSV